MTDNIEQKLTNRQLKAIPFIVTSSTYTDGCKKAKVDRTTFYKWLRQPEFNTELDRKRNEVTADAFGILSQSLTKAVEVLVGLLNHQDDRLKRLAANDVIEYILKYKETEDLEKRVTAIEQRLNEL
ncbi:MAG: phBC6A51 family helix-turn-helix protein [Planctomycetota bacterium]